MSGSQSNWWQVRKKALLRWGNDHLWHRWPLLYSPLVKRFEQHQGHRPRVFFPRTFNEKILYRMLFDRRDHLHRIAGKLEGRDFTRRRTGSDRYLIPQIAVLHRAEEIRSLSLPHRFVMKSNSGSERIYFHRGDAPPDLDHLEALCHSWLSENWPKYQREWCYLGVENAIVLEELLLDEQGHIPADYKFLCFDGVPRLIRLCHDRFGPDSTYRFLTPDWVELEDTSGEYPNTIPLPPPPANLDELLRLAATLSRGMDFVRVDLYNVDGRVYFGELTNLPGALTWVLSPRSHDELLGSYWKQDTRTPLRD